MELNSLNNEYISDSSVVKPKQRRSRDADYICFGVAAGVPDVIHGEQITLRHKMCDWFFLNLDRLAAGGGMDTRIAICALSRIVDIT